MLKIIKFLSFFITSAPKLVIFVLCFFFALASLSINDFKMDASSDSLVLENDDDLKYYREINNAYAASDFLVVIFTPNNNLFERETIQEVREIVSDFESIDGVNSVLSYLDAPLLFSPKMEMTELANNLRTIEDEQVDLRLAKKEFKESPLYSELLVSRDSSSTAIQLTLDFDPEYSGLIDTRYELNELINNTQEDQLRRSLLNDLEIVNLKIDQINENEAQKRDVLVSQVRLIMEKYADFGSLFLGGTAMIASDMMSYVQNDLNTFGLGVFVLFLISLSIVFKNFRWVAIPLLCSAGITFLVIGLLGLLDWRVTVVSSNFVALLLIISISLSIHLIVRYQEVASRGTLTKQKELVAQTYKEMFLPCLYTALTTMVAFASLSVSDIKPVIDFGKMMVLGIAVAFIFIFTALPSLMSLIKINDSDTTKDFKHSATLRFSTLTSKYGNQILVLSSILLIVALIGINKLTVENRFIDYFKDNTEIYRGMELLDRKLGGTAPLDLIINAPKEIEIDEDYEDFEDDFIDDFGDEAESSGYWWNTINIKKIEEIHDYLEDKEEIGKVLSVASGIKVAEELKDGSELSELDLALVKNLLPEDIKETLLGAYISEDENQVRISTRVLETSRGLNRNDLLSSIEKDLKKEFKLEEDQFRLTGLAVLYNNMLQSLFSSQIKTIGIVFGVIFLMFIVLFRSVYLALIGMTPNLLAASVVLGSMGLAKIPLDIMTITVAAISVGMAVDNTIHYIHRFKIEFRETNNYEQSMINSHRTIGRAMFYTSSTIIFGFLVLVVSNFNPTVYFGIFVSLAMFMALIGALTLLPKLLIVFKPLGKETSKE